MFLWIQTLAVLKIENLYQNNSFLADEMDSVHILAQLTNLGWIQSLSDNTSGCDTSLQGQHRYI